MTIPLPAIGVTLLICTHNGAKRLPETLGHIAKQQVPLGIAWEVVVVSNASSDDTLQAAKRLWQELGGSVGLRLFEEPKVGKENALVRGFAEAQYEYMCIIDDDNWLYSDYVAQVVAVMGEQPGIGILGAYAEGAFEVPPPVWFDEFEKVYAVGAQASQAGALPGLYVNGAGSVVRNSAWRQLLTCGFVFTTSTKRGKVMVSGEDIELGNALRLAGYELWYDPRLRLRHFMYKERLTWAYLRRIGRGTASAGMAGIVYFFLLREPNLTLDTFKSRYYKWTVWLIWQLVKKPVSLLTYWFYRNDERHTETFKVMRQIYTLRGAFANTQEAWRVFEGVKKLQKCLKNSD